MSYLFIGCFHVKVEWQTGATALHTTHVVAFQEKCPNSLTQNVKINMERSRKRSCHIDMAVQQNNFEARLCAWDYFIPFYFTFGSLYLESMKYRRQLSWPKRNACTHWAVSARAREVTLENIGRPERRADHQPRRQHITWYKSLQQAKKHKRTTGNVWSWYLQALSSVTNFAIGGTRPERYMYLDGRILSIHLMFGIDK